MKESATYKRVLVTPVLIESELERPNAIVSYLLSIVCVVICSVE